MATAEAACLYGETAGSSSFILRPGPLERTPSITMAEQLKKEPGCPTAHPTYAGQHGRVDVLQEQTDGGHGRHFPLSISSMALISSIELARNYLSVVLSASREMRAYDEENVRLYAKRKSITQH